MLTELALKKLKPKEKPYKVSDRDGMYAFVTKAGAISFRYDYRLNGRRETLVIGRYGRGGIALALAREKCLDARKIVAEGKSPAQDKRREKKRMAGAQRFGEYAEKWIETVELAESTRAMRKAILVRDVIPEFKNMLLEEITSDDLRTVCNKVKERGAPATAIHVRDIVKQIFAYANLHGGKLTNPAEDVAPASIATFKPKDRTLSPAEIRLAYRLLERVDGNPVLKLGVKLVLLTMKRKSEVTRATWDEIDFEEAVWTIPKERMKTRFPHNVYLSQQALDIFVALKTCAGGSRYVFPKRYDPDLPIADQSFNRFTYAIRDLAEKEDLPLGHFTIHDLRRTGSTLLNEMGFNRDWIEKCLAHEDKHSSRGVYNKAEYAEQRRHMLQEWANMIDAWVAGEKRMAILVPPNMTMFNGDPSV